jgi:putative ABC transport system permease protein
VLQTDNINGKIDQSAATPFPLAATLKEVYPEIKRSTRYHNWLTSFSKGDNIIQGRLAHVDRDFFEMFNIEFISGDINSALAGPYNIVITEEMAKRYFGDEDPLGKTMTVSPNYLVTVTGLIKDIPRNSHFYADCLASFEFYTIQFGGNLDDLNKWNDVYNYTFIELAKGSDSKLVEEKIKGIIQRNVKGSNAEIFLQNIRNIHLYSQGKYSHDIETGNIVYVRLSGLVAVLILTIACINFMNLTTAQSFRRAKEIGVRKVAGAKRRKIIFQFMGESLLIVFVAHMIAMILVELFLPGFKSFMFMEVNYQGLGLYVVLITVVLFCGLFAGCYPALYISSIKPLETIKGVTIKNPGKGKFRRILVISQFTLSFLFIICTLVIRSQLNYIQNKNLGLNMDNIAHFEFTKGLQRETLKNELGNNPDIVSVTFTGYQNVLDNWSAVNGVDWKGKKKDDDVLFSVLNADKDYAKTFQLELKEGSFLSTNEFSIDTTVVVINEKAAEIMGFKDPIGEIITHWGLKFKIIGVVKNFHFKTLRSAIDPLIISPIPPSPPGGICYIRMKPDRIASIVNYIRDIFRSHNLDYMPDVKFLNDDYKNIYRIEQIAGALFSYFTFLAIIISCLGLIGLSTFMTVSRTKEIGIRKANGAKYGEIISLLLKEYIKLVVISFVIAAPIAWYATNIWLRGYAYRTNIGWWVFAMALLIVIVIVLLTVGIQSYNAARKRPVEALRYE